MKKRIFSLLCAFALALGIMPMTVFAEDPKPVYLALGDSITEGYGLKEGEKNFATLLAEENSFTLYNEAVSGATSGDLLTSLTSKEIDVSDADLITITIGGNDLMNALYEHLASETGQSAEDIKTLLTSETLTANDLGSYLPSLIKFPTSSERQTALDGLRENLVAILDTIQKENPDATLIVATQYNPYLSFSGSTNFMMQALSSAFGTQITEMNDVINEVVDAAGFIVADVYTEFNAAAEEGENLCNATETPLNLDFHPNAKGHELIAKTINGELNKLSIVTGVTIDPKTATVEKGQTQQFTATVSGIGSYDKTVNWSIVETTISDGTSIDASGLLTVSADETAQTLTVRATAAGDQTKYADATVTITGGSEPTIPDIAINETNFPDENFREYVKTFDTDNSGSLSDEEVIVVTDIDVTNRNITSLKGIEYFTNLEKLNCQDNELTALDVSENTKLENLNCSNNLLKELDLSLNNQLSAFSGNQAFTVDVASTTNQKWSFDLSTLFKDWSKVEVVQVENATLASDSKTVSWKNGAKNPVVQYNYRVNDNGEVMTVTLTLNYTPYEESTSELPYFPSLPAETPEDNPETVKEGWQQYDSGEWYYYQDDELVTGWLKDGNTWYYLDPETGAMATGWQYVNGVWYYLKDWGGMATGWQYINGVWYYLYSWGGMAEGWVLDNGVWYYLDPETGAMQTGWKWLSNKWYYLYTWGGMAYNTAIDGYYLGADGVMR